MGLLNQFSAANEKIGLAVRLIDAKFIQQFSLFSAKRRLHNKEAMLDRED